MPRRHAAWPRLHFASNSMFRSASFCLRIGCKGRPNSLIHNPPGPHPAIIEISNWMPLSPCVVCRGAISLCQQLRVLACLSIVVYLGLWFWTFLRILSHGFHGSADLEAGDLMWICCTISCDCDSNRCRDMACVVT